ncbi:non-ribosomal peptide synthetase [Nonomuraea diastatica]|uniref:Phenyloxazoline synthase MbtB n=1 Tax=Nonomuraea diastatica TaxID=1848329 RepID=A0A4R4VVD5_9ACTN|nr:non-ribosomal peptide synthetase [Nonomuraea diastatica]TDD06734.1 amino acid adenylation domain-containing protein [Nonomuraea diastatica]
MTVSDLVAELDHLGVRLWAEDGRLRYRAPRGVLTEERKARLIQCKAELLAYLEADTATLVADPAARYEPFPLTQMQSAYLLGRHQTYEYGGVACTGYLEIAYEGVAPEHLERAWNELVRRHDMLRAVVDGEGDQRILPSVEDYAIPVTDLSGVPDARVEEHVAAIRRELHDSVGAAGTWPLFALHTTVTDHATVLHLLIELLVVDSASLQLLLAELEQLLLGEKPPPPPAATFRDYVMAERSLRDGPSFHRDRAYWLDRIDDLPPAPELPMLGDLLPRSDPWQEVGPARFRRLSRQLSQDEWTGLRERARRHGVTESGTLLAAYAETIGRWARNRRFSLNLPIFNRLPLHERIDSIVGDFTTVSLLAVDLDAGPSFAERAKALTSRLFDDLDHRLFTGLDVLAELTRRRGRPALMPVVFTSTLGSGASPEREPMGRFLGGLTQTPQVWIDCQVVEQAGPPLLVWDVRWDVLPEGLAEDAFEAFITLVAELATTEQAWADTHPVRLPPAQRDRRAEANATSAPLPGHLLHEPILDHARDTPDRAAVGDARTTLSYGELHARAAAIASRLRAAGCEPGDRIAVVMSKGVEQVVGVLGVLLAGGVYLPLDLGQPRARRDRILADGRVRFALTQSWSEAGDQLPAEVSTIAVDTTGLDDASPELPARLASPDNPAYVIYTSGSTGAPKGVVISHRAAANTIADINARFAVGPQDRVLSIVNLGFDLSVYDIFGVLAAGGTVVIPDADRRADPSHWAHLIDMHGVTLWNSVPSQLRMLQEYVADAGESAATLRLAMLSGDWIPVSLPSRVREHLPGLRIVALGGATEASIWSIVYPIEEVSPGWRSIPYGRPLANQTFHVLDDALRDRPDWVAGELYIGGAGLAQGYLGDPEKTAARFITHAVTGDRLYRTGDLGRYLPDGVIEFLGREDTQVKVRGHRVELGEIEAALRSHPALADAAVLAVGDGDARRLAAFAELGPADVPDQAAGSAEGAAAVIDAAATAWRRAEEALDAEAFTALMRGTDTAAVQAMAAQLRASGLFAAPGTRHTAAEIADATGVADRHRRLLRRWLDALVAAEAVRFDEDAGTFHDLVPADQRSVAMAWDRVSELEERVGYGDGLMRLIRTCGGRLGDLLRGDFDVREALFPDGEFGAAWAVYRENLVARGINGIVAAALRRIAERHGRRSAGAGPLRILEVGAGIAGTTADVVPAMADLAPDYLFTDVSEFFLSEARRTFGEHRWMRYGIFDVNADFRAQGYSPNSADVVLCANVLHNGLNAAEMLARLREMLAPGGWLVFIEPTRAHNYPQLVSMEFEFTGEGFTDDRVRTGRAFFTRDQWLDLLAEAGAEDLICLPPEDSALGLAGQGAFLARFDAGRAYTTAEHVTAHLTAQVPEYMVPGTVHLVDALPRSSNGKLDRSALASMLPTSEADQATETGQTLADDLERSIAELWSELLGVQRVGREQDFYSLGGDSLLLSRMVGRLREQVPEAAGVEWALLTRRMLHDPTVRGLAGYLRSSGGAGAVAEKRESPVVVLSESAGSGEPVCVFVHAGTGTLEPYQPLLARLRAVGRGGLLGLEITDLDRYLALPPEAVIDRLAADYTRELLGHGSTFTVVGYCLGGLLATEVARTLIEAGAIVEGLTVISSYQPPAVDDELMVEYLFAQSMGADLEALGLPHDAEVFGRAVREILAATPERLPDGCLTSLNGEHAAVGSSFRAFARDDRPRRLAAIHRVATPEGAYNSGSYTLAEFTRFFEVFRQSMLAVTRHRADPYAGPVTLLRNSGSSTLLPGSRADVGRFWERIGMAGISVHDLPGDHFGCMSASNAPEIARVLARAGR